MKVRKLTKNLQVRTYLFSGEREYAAGIQSGGGIQIYRGYLAFLNNQVIF
jgi:hypothetical protein